MAAAPLHSSAAAAATFLCAKPTVMRTLRRYTERTTRVARRLSSPVFISTAPDGSRALGLGNIPEGRPLVLVGNHQTLAFELGPLCEQVGGHRGLLRECTWRGCHCL